LSDLLRKARKYFKSWSDFYLFLRIAPWIAILPILLRRYDLETLIRKITPSKPLRSIEPEVVTVYVNWWLNRDIAMFKPVCMKRSLILYRFLRECGMNVRIHYGIKKTPEGENEGHSWLTVNGNLLPPDGQRAHEFRETFSFPPKGSG